jgi:hypothetical protein
MHMPRTWLSIPIALAALPAAVTGRWGWGMPHRRWARRRSPSSRSASPAARSTRPSSRSAGASSANRRPAGRLVRAIKSVLGEGKKGHRPSRQDGSVPAAGRVGGRSAHSRGLVLANVVGVASRRAAAPSVIDRNGVRRRPPPRPWHWPPTATFSSRELARGGPRELPWPDRVASATIRVRPAL